GLDGDPALLDQGLGGVGVVGSQDQVAGADLGEVGDAGEQEGVVGDADGAEGGVALDGQAVVVGEVAAVGAGVSGPGVGVDADRINGGDVAEEDAADPGVDAGDAAQGAGVGDAGAIEGDRLAEDHVQRVVRDGVVPQVAPVGVEGRGAEGGILDLQF